MHRVELVSGGVGHDDDTTFTHEWFVAIQVEEVAKACAHHQDGVHDGVHVVWANKRNTHGENVGLTLHLNKLLAIHVCCGHLMNCFHFTGLNARHLVRSLNGLENIAAHASRGAVQCC